MEARSPFHASADSLAHRRSPRPGISRWIPSASRSTGVLVLALAVVPQASGAQTVTGHSIVIDIEDFRNERGEVIAGLYTSQTAWLRDPVARCRTPIRAGHARCVFTVLGSARLAMAGLHDENGNHDMDRDLIGFPQEGYFFSNDVRGGLGPPSFAAAAFAPPQTRPLIVHVRYGL